jgi:hypothetical protein
MDREQSIGQIRRFGNLEPQKSFRHLKSNPLEETDLMNQVLLTHRSEHRKDHSKLKLINVSLTKNILNLLKQLVYIEAICV